MFGTESAGANVESAIEHIAVAQRIDLLVVAPATANVIAKMARGVADDFLTTLYLATARAIGGCSRHERQYVGARGDAGKCRDAARPRRSRGQRRRKAISLVE